MTALDHVTDSAAGSVDHTCLLERECHAQGVDFASVVKWQYVLTEDPNQKYPMAMAKLGKWKIYYGSGAVVSELLDRNGTLFAACIGIGVDKTRTINGRHRIETLDVGQPDFWSHFETWLNGVAGRYTILVRCGDAMRVYNDPVGMNGCVYRVDTRTVAASALLCLDRPVKPHPYYDVDRVLDGSSKYSLFHTCDKDVRRANPSFYLDLETFEESRFWPRDESFSQPIESYLHGYDQMARLTRDVMVALNRDFQTIMPMSGGQDSRLLLAMSGSELRNVDLFFTHIHNYSSRIDAVVAAEIARRLQLDHEILDKREVARDKKAIRKDGAAFVLGSGLTSPPLREMKHGLHDKIPEGAIVLRGQQTGILRAVFINKLGPEARKNFYWQMKHLNIVPRKEFSMTHYSRFGPEYEEWYDTVPTKARLHTVDLMYLEVHDSSTLGASFPAQIHNFFMSPFNSRDFIEIAMSFDERYRRQSYVVHDILLHLNPALHDVPFDYEFGGHRSLDQIHDARDMDEAIAERRNATIERRRELIGTPEAVSDE